MAETETQQDELSELRQKISALETEREELRAKLRKAREIEATPGKPHEEEKRETKAHRPPTRASVTGSLKSVSDEINKVSRGIFFAGLESLSAMADLTRIFVDKANERAREHTGNGAMVIIPLDVAAASMDALDGSVSDAKKIVDTFYDEYQNEREKHKS